MATLNLRLMTGWSSQSSSKTYCPSMGNLIFFSSKLNSTVASRFGNGIGPFMFMTISFVSSLTHLRQPWYSPIPSASVKKTLIEGCWQGNWATAILLKMPIRLFLPVIRSSITVSQIIIAKGIGFGFVVVIVYYLPKEGVEPSCP